MTLDGPGELDPAWSGSLTADARFAGTPEAGKLSLSGDGDRLSVGQAEVDKLLAGAMRLDLELAVRAGVLLLSSAQLDGTNLTVSALGTGQSDELEVQGRIRDLGLLASGYSGPVTLGGRLTPLAGGASMDLRIQGPAGIDTRVAGRFTNGQADLTVQGSSDAALLNVVADPATLAGALRLDLALRGQPALSSLSGRVTLSGGRIAYPYQGLSLTRTEMVADLAQGRARISATSELTSGGRLRVGGSIGLSAPFDGALDVQLDNLHLRDPELFDTTVNGALNLTGPLLGRARLVGRVRIGETELQVPSTGYASASDLEAVRHVNDSPAVRATRARAGLGAAAGAGQGGGGAISGPDWGLDVTVDAPRRIFLRGRGLDAELGGSIHLGGSLRSVVASGEIGLIRGRLDLLGKRLVLSDASLVLEGDLVPYITVVASNETEGIVSMVSIEGRADAPEVKFTSSPEMPQEEVLAWLLFGRGLQNISVFQAAQLANAVAVLAGRGGEGIVSKLRRGFGFDDLDITTSEDGTASVAAGKYIGKNIYTGIEIDQNGQSKINLNLDLRQGVTVKGRVGSDGQGGIGIFLERDY
ncbi:MAG: translocation/assembly module TamB domain-containing protein [Paracoccaceae bacterium]